MAISIEGSIEWQRAAQDQSAKVFWDLPNRFDRDNQLNSQFHKRATISNFLKKEITETYFSTKSVLYLFGGPDFSYPDLFFPNVESLVLIGLEPIRSVLEIDELLKNGSLETIMADIGRSLADIPFHSYYITKNMQSQFRDYGIETILSAAIILAGYQLVNYKMDFLDFAKTIPCIRFYYRKSPDDIDRQVTYISYNLFSNIINLDLLDLIKRMNLDTAFYKATSFSTKHSKSFWLNQYILDTVKYVVQGDSGIPYSFFNSNEWDIKLFGVYSRPYYSTQNIPRDWGLQKDLNHAYISSMKEFLSQNILPRNAFIFDHDYLLPCPSHVNWRGILPFYFDYGGNLTNPRFQKYTSTLQYAIKKAH